MSSKSTRKIRRDKNYICISQLLSLMYAIITNLNWYAPNLNKENNWENLLIFFKLIKLDLKCKKIKLFKLWNTQKFIKQKILGIYE